MNRARAPSSKSEENCLNNYLFYNASKLAVRFDNYHAMVLTLLNFFSLFFVIRQPCLSPGHLCLSPNVRTMTPPCDNDTTHFIMNIFRTIVLEKEGRRGEEG